MRINIFWYEISFFRQRSLYCLLKVNSFIYNLFSFDVNRNLYVHNLYEYAITKAAMIKPL